jgi:hypothetical protein
MFKPPPRSASRPEQTARVTVDQALLSLGIHDQPPTPSVTMACQLPVGAQGNAFADFDAFEDDEPVALLSQPPAAAPREPSPQ